MASAPNSFNANFDSDLIARYDVSGPRYTSYPAAPQFHEHFGAAEFAAAAHASNDDPIPRGLSLYVHVPFCLSPCFYCGCTRIITRDRGKADSYLARLYREIELTASLFDRDRKTSQLHFGGGTPNFLTAWQMSELIESLATNFGVSNAASTEIGIEVDPRSADADYVRGLASVGFNRLSIGVQDFDPEVQLAINRVQSIEETRAVIEAARESGFRSISVDLIYGLPKQHPSSFSRTLDAIIALAPDRVAVYGYAHLPQRFRAQRQIRAEDMPDAKTRLALIGLAVSKLTVAGYRYIGMDHFARMDDELARAQDNGTLQRNFQGYSTHAACDLIGLGMSAISHVGATFSQNARDLSGYYAALDAGNLPIVRGIQLTVDDVIRADLIQQLMCHGRVDIHAFAARHRLDFPVYFAVSLARLRRLAADDLVELSEHHIQVTARGHFLLRNIAMCFDAYLNPANHVPAVLAAESSAILPRYSRTL
ncbi:MAG: oxygen-independent coproporphyrinogen III oxidase [Dokdonella sp.]